MTQLHKQRFDQLQAIIDSKHPSTDALDRHVHEIDSEALIEWSVKARDLLSKVCGQDSEHHRSFVENEKTQSYDLYLKWRAPQKKCEPCVMRV